MGGERQAIAAVEAVTNIWYGVDMVAKNTSVALGDHFTAFAAEQVASGRYGSMSEVLRAGLRLLEDEERKLDALKAAIREGDESGPAVPFDMRAWIAEQFPEV
jgi:antitoxin ParD1/3/4